jgi:hypothetical protein
MVNVITSQFTLIRPENGFHHEMLPAERLGLSKPVCPGGFRHLFNYPRVGIVKVLEWLYPNAYTVTV